MEESKPTTTGAGSRLATGRIRPPKARDKNLLGEQERRLEISIGLQLRTLRREQGRTITELSRASGLSISMVSKIENGMISPSLSSLQRLGEALSVPLSTFFSGYDNGGSAFPDPAGKLAADPAGDPPAAPPGTGD